MSQRSIRHFGSLERQTRCLVFSEVFSCGVADGGASFLHTAVGGQKDSAFLSIRRLPPFRSRVTFPRADDFIGYPTAIEITWLRAHALAIDQALDSTGIKGEVPRDGVVRGLRFWIAPGNCFQRRCDGCDCPVLRHAFPLANRRARQRLEQFQPYISRRNVEGRRPRGLKDAIIFTRVGDQQIAALDDDPPMVRA